MAIKKCKECGNPVSSRAKTCPHCGISQPGITFQTRLIVAITFVILGFVVLYFLFPDAPVSIKKAIDFIHR